VLAGVDQLCAVKGKKDCTIFSISSVDPKRDDIHCFEYTLLHKEKYLLAPKNLVLFKKRLGSRKAFVTHVTLYQYQPADKAFKQVYDQSFARGQDWVRLTKEYIVKKMPHLVC
jgi:hypothetical protein